MVAEVEKGRSAWRRAPLLAVVIALFAACGVGPDPTGTPRLVPSDPSGPVVVQSNFELPPMKSTVLESLLARIPGDAFLRNDVQVNNFARIRGALQLEPPAAGAGEEALKEYMLALFPVSPDKPHSGLN